MSVPQNSRLSGDRRFSLTSALLLILGLFLLYSLAYNPTFRVDDEHILAARAQSLALWGGLENPQLSGNQRVAELLEMEGAAVAIEPGQSVLLASLYWLGVQLGAGAGIAWTMNLFVTALTAGIVYASVLILGYRVQTAFFVGFAYGLSSMAAAYITTLFRDPLAALFVAAAFLGFCYVITKRNVVIGTILILVGTLSGILVKNSVWAMLPAILVGLLVMIWQTRKRPARTHRALIALLCLLAIGFLVLILAAENVDSLARYRFSYFQFLANHFFRGLGLQTLLAAAGPFLSPARSIFLYTPILLLALLSPIYGRRFSPLVAAGVVFTGLVAVLQALFYAQEWAGVFGWGPRFMLITLPALFLLSAGPIEKLMGHRRGRIVVFFLVGGGVLIQLSAVLLPWRFALRAIQASGLAPFETEAAWGWRFNLIPYQLQGLLEPQEWNTSLTRSLESGVQALWLWILFGLLFILISMVLLRPTQQMNRHGSWEIIAVGIGMVLGLGSLLILGKAIFKEDPAVLHKQAEFAAFSEWLAPQIGEDDLVIIDSYGTPLWIYLMNHWDRNARWHSLPYEIPRPGEELASPTLLIALAMDHPPPSNNLWYIVSSKSPDYELYRELDWLVSKYNLKGSMIFDGATILEVYHFDIGHPPRAER